jgi:hypothetical protein
MTFEEYQSAVTKVPVALRNNRDRVDFPVRGLQEEAGGVGLLLSSAFASGKFNLTPVQNEEAKERLSDIFWYVAHLCAETGITMEQVATHSVTRLQARTKDFDLDRR